MTRPGPYLIVLIGLLFLGSPARAEDEHTFARVALAAFEQEQSEVLTAFAADSHGEAWLVVDGLRALGRRDAAVAMARLRTLADRDAMIRFAEGEAGAPEYDQLVALVDLSYRTKDGPPPTLEALAEFHAPAGSAMQVWLAFEEYLALDGAGKSDEALARVEVSCNLADALGWLLHTGATALIAGAGNRVRRNFPRAIELLERAEDRFRRLGRDRSASIAVYELGLAHYEGFDVRMARREFERAVERWPDADSDPLFVKALAELADSQKLGGDLKAAEQTLARAIPLFERHADTAGTIEALTLLAAIHVRRRAFDKATAIYLDLLARAIASGDESQVAAVHADLAGAYLEANETANARKHLELASVRGGREPDERALGNEALLLRLEGDAAGALRAWEAALATADAADNPQAASTILSNLVAAYTRIGRYADALKAALRAVRVKRELGLVSELPTALENLGNTAYHLGHFEASIDAYDEAIGLYTRWGDSHGVVRCLNGLGGVYVDLGRGEDAVRTHERALSLAREHGFRASEAQSLYNLGRAVQGPDGMRARRLFEQAAALYTELDRPDGQISTWTLLGQLARRAGELAVAERYAEDTLRLTREQGLPTVSARYHLAIVRAMQARWDESLDLMRAAITEIEASARGLDPLSAARMRDGLAHVPIDAIDIARMSGNTAALAEFLELGRSRALLETMARSNASLADVVEPELAALETAARHRLQAAIDHYRRARNDGGLAAARAARIQRDAAQSALESVIAEIRTATGPVGAMLLAEPATLADVQALLAPDEAIIYYNDASGKVLAFTVTPGAARPAVLGPTHQLETFLRQGLPDERPYVDPALLQVPQRRLVGLLRLAPAIRRVFVSASGPLTRVPFSLLFEDKEVVYLPSATTYRLLRSRAGPRGKRVLGFGDPDYASRTASPGPTTRDWSSRLQPLPASRAEVNAVADVAFLGKGATETALRAQLETPEHWRAIHLACHGLLEDRPLRSALALSSDDENDGFLSVLDLFDPELDVRADLVVLSACESARGEAYRFEGVLGLVSAFLASGAPRVLCSGWKVDDEATGALMTKFYELWNPAEGEGLSAATALKRAQAHVRAQEGWEHPYYWGAWQLWGLP